MATKTATKNGAAKKTTPKRINILVKTWLTLFLTISGLNRLVPKAMDAKASEGIIKKQMKLTTKSSKEEARDPIQEAKACLYRFQSEDGKLGGPVNGTIFGIKAVALKKAGTRPFKTIDKFSMADARGGFHVEGAGKCWMGRDDLIPIIADPIKELSYTEREIAGWLDLTEKEMLEQVAGYHKYGCQIREDIVRLQSGVSIPRYRMEFPKWKIPFEVRFNSDWCSEEILINAIDRAGSEVGLCENRPEKSGDNWGTFEVAL
jgi:hypothetical protein